LLFSNVFCKENQTIEYSVKNLATDLDKSDDCYCCLTTWQENISIMWLSSDQPHITKI